MCELEELLFFDTFAHENTEELNLDLVQFPKPVYVTEVRIIPLGARVQADFPGGVRLGATNPSQFKIELFVNDLGKPGASTFETLGDFQYNQNDCINLVCAGDGSVRKIPTDGLVLRGWYTTITLAVYGTLTAKIPEPATPPVGSQSLPQSGQTNEIQAIITQNHVKSEWQEPASNVVPVEYNQPSNAPFTQSFPSTENYNQEYNDFYAEAPKDPRSYHHAPDNNCEGKSRRSVENDKDRDRRDEHDGHLESSSRERDRDKERERERERDRDRDRGDRDRDRDRDRRFSRSHSRDRATRDFREVSRDSRDSRDWEPDRKEWERERDRDRERNRDRDRERDRSEKDRDRYKHQDYRRYSDRDGRDLRDSRDSREARDSREESRKRPRTPPLHSPKRPHTPHTENKETSVAIDEKPMQTIESEEKREPREGLPREPLIEASKEARESRDMDEQVKQEEKDEHMDVEEFEPILSDEDIVDDAETFQDEFDYAAYTNSDDLVKLFTPGVTPLAKYDSRKLFEVGEDNTLYANDYLRNVVAMVDDFFKSSIAHYTPANFQQLNAELKEEFIHLAEKITAAFEDVRVFCAICEIFANRHKWTLKFELVMQIENILTSLLHWLQIALDFNLANSQEQPAYKIRHLKCGIKLSEFMAESEHFITQLWERKFYVHEVLLDLYDREFMALSIKLMILKALDNYLLKKRMIEVFVMGAKSLDEQNGYHNLVPMKERGGYQILVELIDANSSVRLKFALNSIFKKINIFDTLHKLHVDIFEHIYNKKTLHDDVLHFIVNTLEFVLQTMQAGSFFLSQPKRFLPLVSQFEINRMIEFKDPLVELLKMQSFIEIMLVLLTNEATNSNNNVKYTIYEIIEELLCSAHGLAYFYDNIECTNLLVKILLQGEEEQYHLDTSNSSNSHQLGMQLAFKVQALYHISQLEDKKCDCDHSDVIDQLHALYCLTFSNIGKLSVAEVLGFDGNLQTLLHFVRPEIFAKIRKSPAVAYIIDLISLSITSFSNVPLLQIVKMQLIELAHQQEHIEVNEKRLLQVLNELGVFCRPFTQNTVFDVTILMETICKCLGTVATNPGVILMPLRILDYLGISKHCNRRLVQENPLANFTEMKYKHVILQLFTLDGVASMGQVLQEICDHYEQPSLHSATFATHLGFLLVSVIAPCVSLIKQMLTHVIQCRNTQFRDLTAVPILLQTYNLCQSYPSTALGYLPARKVCTDIVDTLLVYTQPISEEIHEKDSLNKSLWSLLCAEIIKYTLSAPYSFIPGLSIFSEVLPLPLPMQSFEELTKEEVAWAINLRKLWSAHLHCHAAMIQDLVGKLCTTSHQLLMNLLRKVCAQIADLNSNSATMIARGVLDNVHSAIVIGDKVPKLVCNGHIARLMNFLACLVNQNSLKVSILHLVINASGTKADEKYAAILSAFAQILRSTSNVASHVSTQECILSIFLSFCDTEITLLQNLEGSSTPATNEIYLANALPTKDYLLMFLNTILDHIGMENSLLTYLSVLRMLLFLTEHDYGFYHMRECLLKERKHPPFSLLLSKLEQNFSKDNADCLNTLNTLLEFLRISNEEETPSSDLPFAPRKMKMSVAEIQNVVGWTEELHADHTFVKLEEKLKEYQVDDASFERLLESVQQIIALLRSPASPAEESIEPVLPPPESLRSQFAGRLIYTSADVLVERLTTSYWLSPVPDENDGEVEHVTCDLIDICRQDLSSDVNLIKQVEKLCRVCVAETSDGLAEKEKRTTQRDKMKRPFVTSVRGRGFPRTVQVRSDLFRSRPPNTSRPPSLHVDDFVALETCGAQPTGPTGYNKISRELLATGRLARSTRGRSFAGSERVGSYRQMSWWGPGRTPY